MLALRPGARSFARFPGAENLVHAEDLRHGEARSCDLALLAPVNLNIVCFRYRAGDANRVNGEIVINLQESGIAAPSTTMVDGQLAIRAAIVNHRTDARDIDALVEAVLAFGARRAAESSLPVVQAPPLAM